VEHLLGGLREVAPGVVDVEEPWSTDVNTVSGRSRAVWP
jgi:hypothetical protein